MTDAAAVTEVAPTADTSEMSNAELVALASKMTDEAEASVTPKPVDKIAEAVAAAEKPADAPAEAHEATADAPAEAAAPVADPVAERLARVLENAGAWREKKALREAQAKHEAEVSRVRAEAEATKAEAAALKARLDAYKADPLAQLEADGFPADKLAQRALQTGTPEYQAEMQLKALKEQMLAEVRSEREAAAKAIADERARIDSSQREAAYERARQDFVKQAADVSAYPTLAKIASLRPQALVQHAEEILQEASQRTGQAYTNVEVLTYLENLYASNFGQPNQKSAAAASVTSPEKSAGTGAPGTNAAGKTRTLTNSMTEKTAVASPAFDEMSDADFRKAAAELMKSSK